MNESSAFGRAIMESPENDDTFMVEMTNARVRVNRAYYADVEGLRFRAQMLQRMAAQVPAEQGETRDAKLAALEKSLVIIGYGIDRLANKSVGFTLDAYNEGLRKLIAEHIDQAAEKISVERVKIAYANLKPLMAEIYNRYPTYDNDYWYAGLKAGLQRYLGEKTGVSKELRDAAEAYLAADASHLELMLPFKTARQVYDSDWAEKIVRARRDLIRQLRPVGGELMNIAAESDTLHANLARETLHGLLPTAWFEQIRDGMPVLLKNVADTGDRAHYNHHQQLAETTAETRNVPADLLQSVKDTPATKRSFVDGLDSMESGRIDVHHVTTDLGNFWVFDMEDYGKWEVYAGKGHRTQDDPPPGEGWRWGQKFGIYFDALLPNLIEVGAATRYVRTNRRLRTLPKPMQLLLNTPRLLHALTYSFKNMHDGWYRPQQTHHLYGAGIELYPLEQIVPDPTRTAKRVLRDTIIHEYAHHIARLDTAAIIGGTERAHILRRTGKTPATEYDNMIPLFTLPENAIIQDVTEFRHPGEWPIPYVFHENFGGTTHEVFATGLSATLGHNFGSLINIGQQGETRTDDYELLGYTLGVLAVL